MYLLLTVLGRAQAFAVLTWISETTGIVSYFLGTRLGVGRAPKGGTPVAPEREEGGAYVCDQGDCHEGATCLCWCREGVTRGLEIEGEGFWGPGSGFIKMCRKSKHAECNES
jgi:hypothetical protein